MRTTLSVLLLILTVSVAHAETSAPPAVARDAAPVHVEPIPKVVSGSSVTVEPTRAEIRVKTADVTVTEAVQQPRDRSYWFLLGAAVALVAVLVLVL